MLTNSTTGYQDAVWDTFKMYDAMEHEIRANFNTLAQLVGYVDAFEFVDEAKRIIHNVALGPNSLGSFSEFQTLVATLRNFEGILTASKNVLV